MLFSELTGKNGYFYKFFVPINPWRAKKSAY